MTQSPPVPSQSVPSRSRQTPATILRSAAGGFVDIVLFLAVLAFTGIAMIAVAIVAPLAVGISAIIGRPQRPRSSWRPAKAG